MFGARPRLSAEDLLDALAPFMAEHNRLLEERKEMKAEISAQKAKISAQMNDEISALKERLRALQLHCGITPPPSPSPPRADKNCADKLAVRPPTPPRW